MAANPGPPGPLGGAPLHASATASTPAPRPLGTSLFDEEGGTELHPQTSLQTTGMIGAPRAPGGPSPEKGGYSPYKYTRLTPAQLKFTRDAENKLRRQSWAAGEPKPAPAPPAPSQPPVAHQPLDREAKQEPGPHGGGEATVPDYRREGTTGQELTFTLEEHSDTLMTLSAEHDEELAANLVTTEALRLEIEVLKNEAIQHSLHSLTLQNSLDEAQLNAEVPTVVTGPQGTVPYQSGGASALLAGAMESFNTAPGTRRSREEEMYLKPVYASEVSALTFDVEPRSFRLNKSHLLAYLAVRNPVVHEICLMTEAKWEEVNAEPASRLRLQPHNRWLAFTLKMLFQRPSVNTTAFEMLILAPSPAMQQIDGRWLMKRLEEPVLPYTGKQLRERNDEFVDAVYLVPGAPPMESCAAIASLKLDFEALPTIYAALPNAYLHALLSHFHKICPTKSEELSDELVIEETGGVNFRHNEAQLISLIALHVSKTKKFEVMATERTGLNVDKNERERGARRDGGRDRKKGALGGQVPCTNCGDDPKGGAPLHHPMHCKYEPLCYGVDKKGIRGCPCGNKHPTEQRVKGESACVLNWKSCPAGNVVAFDGSLMKPYMQEWYTKAYQAKNGTTGTARTSPTASISVVEYDNLILGNRFDEIRPNIFALEFTKKTAIENILSLLDGSKMAAAATTAAATAASIAEEIVVGEYISQDLSELCEGDECNSLIELVAATAEVNAVINNNYFEALVDGGANVNLMKDPAIYEVSEIAPVGRNSCEGAFKESGVEVTEMLVFNIGLLGLPPGENMSLEAYWAPNGRHNIISESWLHDNHGASVYKEPHMSIVFPGGDSVPLIRRNGLYYAKFNASRPPTITTMQCHSISLEINAAASNLPYGQAVQGVDRAALWAARLGVNARTLQLITRATTGTGLDQLSTDMRNTIDADPVGIRQRLRRKFIPGNPTDLTLLPGSLLHCDTFGPVEPPSIVDRSHYQMLMVCSLSGFVGGRTAVKETVEGWLDFIDARQAYEKSIGNKILRLRFDGHPMFSSTGSIHNFEKELNRREIHLEVCAGTNHAANGRVEQVQDQLERKAEAWMARSQPRLGLSYLLPARSYAAHVINLSVASAETKTRQELHHPGSGPPDMTTVPPLLFGTSVCYTTEPGKRGPKGNLDTRAPVAKYLGFARDPPTAYLILCTNGNVVARSPRGVVPLDEVKLVKGKGATEGGMAQLSSGEGASNGIETSSREGRATVFPAPLPHDAFLDPSMRGPPSTRLTRDRLPTQHYSPAIHALEVLQLSSQTEAELVHSFNDLAYSLVKPGEDVPEVVHASEVSSALAALVQQCGTRRYELPKIVDDNEASTADVNVVDKTSVLVKTEFGEHFVSIPKGVKAVMNDVNCESWLDADRKAIDVLLSIPNNHLVPINQVPEDEPVIPCVMARTFKIDRVTGEARTPRSFYSRLAADGAAQESMLERRGKGDELKRPVHAQSVDQLAVFMGIAKAAVHGLSLIALDAPNAYQQGKRTRPVAYVQLPQTIADEYDAPDGSKMCIEFGGPIQGEKPAGDEWDLTVTEVVEDLGWTPAEGVPALYTIDVGDGVRAELHKNVDEFLLIAKPGSPIVQATIDGMNAAWGTIAELGKMKVDMQASEWRGYTFARDYDTKCITIYMSSYLESAVARWIPEILTDKSTRPSANMPKGVSVKDVVLALLLPPAALRAAKLTSEQKNFQSITGDLVFPSPTQVRNGLAINRLLSVMCFPPIGPLIEGQPTVTAIFAAKLVLEACYDSRYDGITAGGPSVESSPRLVADLHAHLDMTAAPPLEPEIMGDATWSALPHDHYALAATYLGLLIKWRIKTLKTMSDSSMGAEMHPTTEAGLQAEYISEVARAQGMPLEAPVIIATDSLSNALVSRRQGTTVLVRHQLRRWQALTARISRGLAKVVHLPDAEMPVDFLTKWVSKKKIDASVWYLTNGANRVKHPAEP